MAASNVQDGHSPRARSREAPSDDLAKDDEEDNAAANPKKAFFLKRLWDKLGLNIGLVLTMVK